MTAIGFTGTQIGMTAPQLSNVQCEISRANEWHHGDCLGADLESATAAIRQGVKTVAHPPENPVKRAWHVSTIILAVLPYLVRNHAIVDDSDELVAAPATMAEERRSGTWATIRYARKVGRPIAICWPDGTVTREPAKAAQQRLTD